MSISRKQKAEHRKQVKAHMDEVKKEMNKIDGVYYKDDPKENLHATILVFGIFCLFLLFFLPRRFGLTPGSHDYFETNGMIAVMMLGFLIFVFGYFPEILAYWISAFKKLKKREKLLDVEKEHLIVFVEWVIAMTVFFGIVDFSFLSVKGGIPRIGSVAALSLLGLLSNIYRTRKANWQERKRIRDHEKHIEEIRSRRNPPSEK